MLLERVTLPALIDSHARLPLLSFGPARAYICLRFRPYFGTTRLDFNLEIITSGWQHALDRVDGELAR
jgi:hypothetical protein